MKNEKDYLQVKEKLADLMPYLCFKDAKTGDELTLIRTEHEYNTYESDLSRYDSTTQKTHYNTYTLFLNPMEEKPDVENSDEKR